MTSQHDKPQRWRPRFSVRMLLGFTAIAALITAWCMDHAVLRSELVEERFLRRSSEELVTKLAEAYFKATGEEPPILHYTSEVPPPP